MSNKMVSEQGKRIIRQFEGLRLTAYKCAAGVWTIGYGHTRGVSAGLKCTTEQAELWLLADLRPIEAALTDIGVPLTQNQIDALASFAFNVGVTALRNSRLLRKVKANPSDPSIRDEFMRWVYSKGIKLKGLENRRKKEAELYFS